MDNEMISTVQWLQKLQIPLVHICQHVLFILQLFLHTALENNKHCSLYNHNSAQDNIPSH